MKKEEKEKQQRKKRSVNKYRNGAKLWINFSFVHGA